MLLNLNPITEGSDSCRKLKDLDLIFPEMDMRREYNTILAHKRLSRAFRLEVESSHVDGSMRTNPLRAPFVVLHRWSRSSVAIVQLP